MKLLKLTLLAAVALGFVSCSPGGSCSSCAGGSCSYVPQYQAPTQAPAQ